jgi:hypothetical protein
VGGLRGAIGRFGGGAAYVVGKKTIESAERVRGCSCSAPGFRGDRPGDGIEGFRSSAVPRRFSRDRLRRRLRHAVHSSRPAFSSSGRPSTFPASSRLILYGPAEFPSSFNREPFSRLRLSSNSRGSCEPSEYRRIIASGRFGRVADAGDGNRERKRGRESGGAWVLG